ELVQWVAVRIADGALFEAVLRPVAAPPSAHHLAHMRLAPADVAGGESLAGARARFAAWLGGAPVATWTQSSLDWAAPLLGGAERTVLKTNYCNLVTRRAGFLERIVADLGLPAAPLGCRGRAAERLGNALAVARWLAARRAELHPHSCAVPGSTSA